MMADLPTGEVRPLTETPGLYSQAVWSPDGQWLAFTDESGGLNIVPVSNGEWLTLSDSALGPVAPAWLDADHVVYVRSTGSEGLAELVSQPLDGSTPHVLLKDVARLRGFALSPNGAQMVYFDGLLNLVDLPSGVTQRLGLEPSEGLQWSPNGQYLLGRSGLAGVYLVQPSSSAPATQANVLGVPGLMQSWAPDSQRFAVLIGPEDELPSIGIYSVDTQMLSELPVIVYPPYALAWSTR